jgi:ubiquinone/menaquinone biosynthesis C-methylase UbiE
VGGFWAREDYERVLEGAGFARVTGEDLTLGAASLVRAEKPS